MSETQWTKQEESRAGRVHSKVLLIKNPRCSSVSWCGYLSFAPDNTVKSRDCVGKLAESAGWKSREHFRFPMALLPLCVFSSKSHYPCTVRVIIHSLRQIKRNCSIGSMVIQIPVKKTLYPHVLFHTNQQYIILWKNAFSHRLHTRKKPRSSCSYLWLTPNRRRQRESPCLLLLTKCCTVLLVQIILFCLEPGCRPRPGVPPARPPWTDLRSLQTCGRITRPPSLTRDRVSPQDITQRGGTRSGQ